MSRAQVYCNGHLVGEWPYGYSSFAFDLTGHVSFGSENVIAIRLENKEHSSRWYPGAGLYRHVRIVYLEETHVAHWGTYVTTPEVGEGQGTVCIRTRVENYGAEKSITLKTDIKDSSGTTVASITDTKVFAGNVEFEQAATVACPERWMPGNPNLYAAVSTVLIGGEEKDVYETNFGFRTLRFDPDKGFLINDQYLKLNGVCMHHDLGPLGAAVNRTALKRQLEILQDMGCNAIRTSHNPPAPELLDLCDEMGFVLIDEAFDEWAEGKMTNG